MPRPAQRGRRRLHGPLFVALLAATASQASESQRDYFARFDDDGDGRIGSAEYVAYLTRGFDTMDVDGNARLDGHELPVGLAGRRPRERSAFIRDLQRAFLRQDRNRDGWLSSEELLAPPR